MKSRQPDPLRLDVAAFTADGGELAGAWPGADLSRLAELQSPPQDTALAAVDWRVAGEQRPVAGGTPEIWLTLQARGQVWQTCQRCLQPMAHGLEIDRRLRFVRGEAQAEALDNEIEDDVLALTRSLDLRELVEDEFLLALPIVPRHEVCPQPLPMPADDLPAPDAAESARANPFAALQALKVRKAD